MDLLAIQPHKVSRDLSGYITFIYGPAKIGKTTFGAQMPGALILAFEQGYRTLPDVIAQPINSWGEFKQAVRELKKPEVQDRFKSLIVDTVDIAADLCQKYVCSQLGIENIGDGGWTTNGWAKYKKEFEETFRSLVNMGYAIVFISHDKEKTIKLQNTPEYQQIGSSLQSSALTIVENMSDIIGYAHMIQDKNGENTRVLTLRSNDGTIRCGCRFRYVKSEIPFYYKALEEALNEAIDKEAAEVGEDMVTKERQVAIAPPEYDYEGLMKEFQQIAGTLMEKDPNYNGPRITQIIDKYLGKGKKVADATIDQSELISLIISEIKDTLM